MTIDNDRTCHSKIALVGTAPGACPIRDTRTYEILIAVLISLVGECAVVCGAGLRLYAYGVPVDSRNGCDGAPRRELHPVEPYD